MYIQKYGIGYPDVYWRAAEHGIESTLANPHERDLIEENKLKIQEEKASRARHDALSAKVKNAPLFLHISLFSYLLL